jgi:hypothetical protein
MKRYIKTAARFTGFVIGSALFVGAANAGDIVKGGERQLNLLGINTKAVPDGSGYAPMACPKCNDNFVQRVDWTARGANKPTVLVTKHLCGGCDTTITTVGRGKQARDIATHKCDSCGAELLACCSTKKGTDSATKGMEKKFEIAPLK